jgi:hypothetical protein
VGVFGAAFTDRLIADSLCPVESFLFHPTDETCWSRMALLICALRAGIKKLQSKCPNSTPTQNAALPAQAPHPSLNLDRSTILPYRQSFVDAEDQSIHTVSGLHHFDKDKIAYSGVLDNTTTRVFVKYVQSYSEEAHRACYDLGFAPKLLGSGTLHARWRMIVTEWLDPQKWKSLFYPVAGNHLTQARVEYALEKISEFGKTGWVHGDVRDANVMVFVGSKNDVGEGGGGVLLVDFDWSGRHGEVLYPHNMEVQRIRRARDAKRLGVIKPEHDLEMMTYICRLRTDGPWTSVECLLSNVRVTLQLTTKCVPIICANDQCPLSRCWLLLIYYCQFDFQNISVCVTYDSNAHVLTP